MKLLNSCAVCGGDIFLRCEGRVAPFIAKRIWNSRSFKISIVECRDCGFIFFNPRLEPDEEQRLYDGYRGHFYQTQRERIEPWYTSRFNRLLSDPALLNIRKKHLRNIIDPYCDPKKNIRLLDFGGDRGQLVQGLRPNISSFVYDVSGVDPVEGVQRISELSQCRELSFDLIITSNVLEHVGAPRDFLGQIISIANPHTMILAEVPYESPFEWRSLTRRSIQLGIISILRPHVAFQQFRPGALHLMHEHINFFSHRSLIALFETNGFKIVSSGSYRLNNLLLGKATSGWSLATKNLSRSQSSPL